MSLKGLDHWPFRLILCFWMHLEVLWLVSHLYRALIVTEETLVQETLVCSPESAECTKITDFLRLHSVPKLISPYFLMNREPLGMFLAVIKALCCNVFCLH